MKTGLESLDTGAPEITYEGNEGPKSPQQEQQMQMAQLQEEYEKHVFEMEEQGLQPMSMEQFMDQIMSEGQMSSNQEGIGSMMQDSRQMAAGGGIMRTGFQGGGASYGDSRRSGPAGGATMGGQGNVGGASNRDSRGPRDDPDRSGPSAPPAPAVSTPTFNIHSDTGKAPYEIIDGQRFAVDDPRIDEVRNVVEKPEGFLPRYIDKRLEGMYNMVPNKFSWTYDKRKRFVNSLYEDAKKSGFKGTISEWQNKNLGYNFNKPWDDLTDTDKNILMSYDVYKDLNKTGYQDWIKADNERKFGKPGGGDGPIYYPGHPNYVPEGSPVSGGGTSAVAAAEEEESSIPTSSVATGANSNQYYIPGGSNFYSNLPSNQFNQSTNMLTLADGGRIGYAGGGITDLRQGYFLGKIVKKVKKIAKSPLGMAALVYFGGGGGLGSFKGFGGKGFGGSKLAKMIMGSKTTLPGTKSGGLWNWMKGNPFSTIAGASALGGLYTGMNPEDEEDGYDYAEKDKWLKYHAGVGDKKNWQSIRGLADGGRIGYAGGKDHRAAALSAIYGEDEDEDEDNMYNFAYGGSTGLPPVTMQTEGQNIQSFPDDESTGMAQATTLPSQMPRPQMDPRMMQMAQQQNMPRRMAAEGGLMDLGGMEKDYRAEGGFVPLGGEERADDVPARLSKNEFVFTADAVRSAGSGDIDKGAEVMENLMENLEQGGQVSQGSQGLEGARDMFQTQQRLGEVL